MTNKEIMDWFYDRGYSVQLNKHTAVFAHWYRIGNSGKELATEVAFSSKPKDYPFLLSLIEKGKFERLDV